MRKVVVFEQVTLDGYFADAQGDMSWAHKTDPEWNAFAADNASAGGMLLFGRITYELMASFWPTPMAFETAPVIAKQMTDMPKVVFSRTLDEVSWANTRLVKGGVAAEVRRMKSERGPDMAVLGSGSIVSQLAQEGLIDEYKIVVNPLALGRGKTLFDRMTRTLALKLTRTRAFKNGNFLLCYEPAP
jgi:dihydrofolate reductase